MPKLRILILIFIVVFAFIGAVLVFRHPIKKKIVNKIEKNIPEKILSNPTVLPTKSVEDVNKLYGPCFKISVLMYHHIEEDVDAKAKKQSSLNVSPDFFRKHLEYLRDKGYRVIEPKDLIAILNGSQKIGGKLAMITLDDAYSDNYSKMYPILKEFGYKATIFTPTGLVNNPDYLSLDQMKEMKDSVYFANHTWSHHSSAGTKEVLDKEIGTADLQLSENGFNPEKIFAYPYGNPSLEAINVLKEKKYNIAFTTKHGNILCRGKALELSRIRVGNAPLSSYGL
ncbi:MAG: polysaccharide deacetylase family protein [Candidatus Shapirobacteria bacterium]